MLQKYSEAWQTGAWEAEVKDRRFVSWIHGGANLINLYIVYRCWFRTFAREICGQLDVTVCFNHQLVGYSYCISDLKNPMCCPNV